jgi:hypothetical protein
MKKRIQKSKPKSAAAKAKAARKSPVRAAAAVSPHDPLHSLLRGAHAHRVCGSHGG